MRHPRPFESRKRRLELRRTHIDPDNVAQLDARIGRQLDLPAESARLGLGGNLGALTGDVVFPAVIGAAQPVLLVAAEPERYAAVGAELVDHAHAPLRVAKRQQPFRKKLDAHRRPIRLAHLLRQQRRNPIAPKQTGPGTPMGDLFRRYWIPALLSEEVGEPDGTPVRVKLLSERLLAFRDTQGRV